ncbi:uncharacterized protein KZ484_020193 isoform 3-T3 [Pholidichthys leucotaenia]
MDLGFVFSNICVLLFVVLFTGGDEASCPCPAIPPKNLTKTPPKECFKITARYRYTCIEGYVRKAGTSDLTRCQQTTDGAAKWSISSLECIRDPKLPPIITTTTTTTTIRTTTKEPVKSDSTIPQLTSTKKPETTTSTGTPTPMSLSTLGPTAGEPDKTQPTAYNENKILPTVTPTLKDDSTLLPHSRSNNTMEKEAHQGSSNATTVGVTTALLVLVCLALVVGILLYRRMSRKSIPLQTEEEMRAMNPDTSGLESQ